jgi:hypothetical protein
MAESFLEEQLERIRRMSEQMERARRRAAELGNEIARDRKAIRYDPIQEVRDLTYEPGQSHDDAEPEPPHRPTASDSIRRRRRP